MVTSDIHVGGASKQNDLFKKSSQKACPCPQSLQKALDDIKVFDCYVLRYMHVAFDICHSSDSLPFFFKGRVSKF